MAGPGYDLRPYLRDAECPLVIAYSSGLKLDQAGLELANVGIVRVFARWRHGTWATALRQLRGLTGAGLTLDELSALSAPWFMDRAYADRYSAAIFANNRALAAGDRHALTRLRPRCHPSLVDPSGRGAVLRTDTQRALTARAIARSKRRDRTRMRAPRPARHQRRFVRLSRPSLRADRARAEGRDLPARGDGLARRLEPPEACASCSPSSLRAGR